MNAIVRIEGLETRGLILLVECLAAKFLGNDDRAKVIRIAERDSLSGGRTVSKWDAPTLQLATERSGSCAPVGSPCDACEGKPPTVAVIPKSKNSRSGHRIALNRIAEAHWVISV